LKDTAVEYIRIVAKYNKIQYGIPTVLEIESGDLEFIEMYLS